MDQDNSHPQEQREGQKPSEKPTHQAIERESYCAQFPMKLYKMLEDAEKFNFSSAISWMDDGKAFVIIDKNRLENEIMPKYFSSGKWKSFQRSLNMWGFKCDRTHRVILPGPGYRRHHPLFMRGKMELCFKMRRIQTEKTPVQSLKKKKEAKPTPPKKSESPSSPAPTENVPEAATTNTTSDAPPTSPTKLSTNSCKKSP